MMSYCFLPFLVPPLSHKLSSHWHLEHSQERCFFPTVRTSRSFPSVSLPSSFHRSTLDTFNCHQYYTSSVFLRNTFDKTLVYTWPALVRIFTTTCSIFTLFHRLPCYWCRYIYLSVLMLLFHLFILSCPIQLVLLLPTSINIFFPFCSFSIDTVASFLFSPSLTLSSFIERLKLLVVARVALL